MEIVTPIPKVPDNITSLAQLRKISGTWDYSKIFEGFLKKWIVNDIYPNLDKCQFGDQQGTGTEHVLVYFIDRVLQLLEPKLNVSSSS